MPDRPAQGQRYSYVAAFGIYTVAFLAVASPWLIDVVRIPWDSVSQFYPQFAFLARSFASGQSPFWTPNVFAGWPQIADPQSLVFSPLHLLVALFAPNPTPASVRRGDVRPALRRRRGRDAVVPRPRAGMPRRRWLRRWPSASAARPPRASSISGRSRAWCSCRSRCGCWCARWSVRRGSRAPRRACSRRSSCSAAIRWR